VAVALIVRPHHFLALSALAETDMEEPYDYLERRLQAVLGAALAIVMIAVVMSWLTGQQIAWLIVGAVFTAGILPCIVWAIWRPNPFPIEIVIFAVGAILISASLAGSAALAYDRLKYPLPSDNVVGVLSGIALLLSGCAFIVYWIMVFLHFLWSLFPSLAPPRETENPLRDKIWSGSPDSARSGFDLLLFCLGAPFFAVAGYSAWIILPAFIFLMMPPFLLILGSMSALVGTRRKLEAKRQQLLESATRRPTGNHFARLKDTFGTTRRLRDTPRPPSPSDSQ
jgi:hypothetical protein